MNAGLAEVCENLADFCEDMATRLYEKGKVKKLCCPTCKRLTGKQEFPPTKGEHRQMVSEFLKRAKKFRGIAIIFRET